MVGCVLGALCASFAAQGLDTGSAKNRVQQHLQQPSESELGVCAVCGGEAELCTHLPILEIDTSGSRIPGKVLGTSGRDIFYETGENGETEIPVQFRAVDEQGQWHHLDDEESVSGTALFRVRGHSSRYFSKSSYRLKVVEAEAQTVKMKQSILGMDAASEWALYGPFLDKTLMRNYMCMNLSAQIMDGYVPEVRFCELVLDGEYQGVYVLMEMISVGNGRLELKKYRTGDPVFSYLVRIEPRISEERWIETFTYYTYRMEENRRLELAYPSTKDQTEQVKEYVRTDLSEIERMLYVPEKGTGQHEWKERIDLSSFADYYIIEEFLAINDAFSASTYFYKDARGKLCVGPVWDFNNALDNFFEPMPDDALILEKRSWYGQMMRDREFVDLVIRRYRELRKTVLSEENLLAYVAQVDEWLGGAIERNDAVWGYAYDPDLLSARERRRPEPGSGSSLEAVNPSSHEEAVEWMCEYIVDRGRWMDEHIETLRQYCHPSKYASQTVE